jgi:antitoxin component YwqK of YwqJK toxin-antitoxin module|tara:strand:+ start:49 stop:306 length:258 start_codon:yes stop_codon:yes gene_type:complete
MKKILLIMLLLIVGCSKEPINYETTLVERDGVTFTKDTNKPYSGKWTSWYDNGQKKAEGTYNNGKQVGKWTYYKEDGTIDRVEEY